MPIYYGAVFLVILATLVVLIARAPKAQPNTPQAQRLYTIGNAVAVFEALDTTHNWEGTIVHMQGDTITVRDNAYPYGVSELPRAEVFPIGTDFNGPDFLNTIPKNWMN